MGDVIESCKRLRAAAHWLDEELYEPLGAGCAANASEHAGRRFSATSQGERR